MGRIQLLAATSLALFLASCGTTVRGLVSAPLGEEKWTEKDYDWELREEDLFLTVGSANFRQDGKPFEADHLPIWIRIKPLVDSVAFDTKTCFGVDFEIDATPGHSSTLKIAGITVGDTTYPAKEVAFREAEYEIYFDFYHGTPDYVYVRPVSDE